MNAITILECENTVYTNHQFEMKNCKVRDKVHIHSTFVQVLSHYMLVSKIFLMKGVSSMPKYRLTIQCNSKMGLADILRHRSSTSPVYLERFKTTS